MRKNVLLVIAVLWMISGVISSDILSRAVDLSLAISFLASYLLLQFTTNSTQKMWLERVKFFSLGSAGVFLIWEIYARFIA